MLEVRDGGIDPLCVTNQNLDCPAMLGLRLHHRLLNTPSVKRALEKRGLEAQIIPQVIDGQYSEKYAAYCRKRFPDGNNICGWLLLSVLPIEAYST